MPFPLAMEQYGGEECEKTSFERQPDMSGPYEGRRRHADVLAGVIARSYLRRQKEARDNNRPGSHEEQ